jgi:hypothetical protein
MKPKVQYHIHKITTLNATTASWILEDWSFGIWRPVVYNSGSQPLLGPRPGKFVFY